jgi:hypothetical protein
MSMNFGKGVAGTVVPVNTVGDLFDIECRLAVIRLSFNLEEEPKFCLFLLATRVLET